MEDKNKFISPTTDEELWTSPMDLYSEHVKNERGLMMSTPNIVPWKSLSMSLEGSDGSSQQDSGYCSFTPSSTSFQEELLSRRCQWCSKTPRENYELSPPPSICNCKKRFLPKKLSSNPEYLQTISETKSTSSGMFLTQGRPNIATDLFDEAMDTSLYHDELAVENHQVENHGCQTMEIGDEKSIDFIDSNLLYLSKNTSSDITGIKERESVEEECKFGKFSSQIPLLGCDTTTRHLEIKEAGKRDDNFLSVAKKVVSMNRVVKSFTLTGIEKLDIFYQLTSKRLHCPHIVSKIFSYLSEKDLDSVALVSKLWNELLCNDFPAYNRWKLYKTTKTWYRENITSPKKESPGWRTRASPLSPLQLFNENRPQRSNSLNTPRRSPPVSPQSARFRSFQKAAKTLKKGERLLPCPKCFFPSHDRGSPTLQCSRSGCRHRFCVWCRNEIFTGVNHDCPPRYTPRSQSNSNYKIAAVGSKTCKRKLRRLTLDK